MNNRPLNAIPRCLTFALAISTLAVGVADATPYATSLTNNAGTVSFRLNQTTDSNDTVVVVSSAGVVTNALQIPGTTPLSRGLIVTNLGIAAGNFQVRIIHQGSGVIATNSPTVAMGAVRGIAANVNPASAYFGWIYVSDSATNSNSRGDGLFGFSSDLSDIMGQGNKPANGGYTGFGSSTTFSPYKISVAPDDSVLVADDSDPTANLIALAPTLTNAFSYVLAPILVNTNTGITGAAPVGSNNVHGSIAGAVIVGTGANRVLYTTDEDYQRDPTSPAATEWNSVWEYNIGNGPLPWSNAPNRIVASPFLTGFAGQNQGLQYHQFGSKHYLYFNQRRSNPPQHDVYVVDLDNLPDPSTYGGTAPYAGAAMIWTSQDESLAEGYSDDVLRDMNQITVSQDGRWLAGIIAAGSATITAPDGSTFATAANDIILIPITNGLPNLPARQTFKFGGAGNGRDIAFDAANNLICGSSGLGYVQSLDIGESTDVTTDSAGTFSLTTPATQVSVTPSTPLAYEQGSVPGVFTIARTPEDLGHSLNVFWTISGTASNGVDYVAITNRATIAVGQTSTNVLVTPIDDAIPELTETVILTVKGSGGYSLGFPSFAQVAIVDNETPQLQILSLSTNLYQGTTNDYAALRLRRFGDTNVPLTLDASSFAIGGTAVSNVDYYLANLPITIGAGVVDSSNAIIYPGLSGSSAVGSRTILLTNLAGGGYTVTNNTAATTLTLKGVPPETVLFSDNFENDPDGTNWNVYFATYTNASTDYNVVFGYDYSVANPNPPFNLLAIPPAPHSTSGDTKGLYMTVNKSDSLGVAAAVNLYLKNHNFSNNFALRFDLYLVENSSGTAQSRNENVIFGINHDGFHTNWFRNAQTGTDLPGKATASDGLWCDIGIDGNGGGGAGYDFGVWSSPTYTNTAAVIGPTNFLVRAANTTRQIFKKPPFDGGTGAGGAPANTVLNPTPTWVEAELSQIGNLITWKINNTVIFSFINTNNNSFGVSIPYTNGTVMLGYVDPWDDIGNGSAGSGDGCAIFDNVRVVSITAPTIITQPTSIVAPAGTSTNLSVVASTVTGVTNYQWLRNGSNLVGQTSATLSLPSLTFADFGTYAVVVNDGAYSTQSTNVTVLPTQPIINTQPVGRAAVVGSTPLFSVVATTFSGRTNYQWYTNTPTGVIVNRTNAILGVTNAQLANFRGYNVNVNDGFNTVTSTVVQLTLAVSQTITSSLAGSTFSLQFGSEFGPAYVVEYKTNLTDATWKPLSTNAGTGSPITVTDSVLGAATRFYRVRLQ